MNKHLLILLVFFVFMGKTNLGYSEAIFTYLADDIPSQRGWDYNNNHSSYESSAISVDNRILHIEDKNTYDGSAIQYKQTWEVVDNYTNIAEFVLKSVSCSSFGGIYISINIGTHHIGYTIYPDKIVSYRSGESNVGSYNFDTASNVNTYKVLIIKGKAKLYINGLLVIEGLAGIGNYTYQGTSVSFGAGSSAATSEAYFYDIKAYRVLSADLDKVKHIAFPIFL